MKKNESVEVLKQRIQKLERNLAERVLREKILADEVFWRRLLIQESRDGIVIINQKGEVFDCNTRFAHMLGYPPEEVSRLFVWDWDYQYSREEILEMLKDVSSEGHHFNTKHKRKDGTVIDVELSNNGVEYKGQKYIFCICRDITEIKRHTRVREKLLEKLQNAQREIETLREILPLCSFCKKVRDDEGHWENVDRYISSHSHSEISHSVCPECYEKHYAGKKSLKPNSEKDPS